MLFRSHVRVPRRHFAQIDAEQVELVIEFGHLCGEVVPQHALECTGIAVLCTQDRQSPPEAGALLGEFRIDIPDDLKSTGDHAVFHLEDKGQRLIYNVQNAEQDKELECTLTPEEYKERVKPISNVYTVFNAAQIDGIPQLVIEHHNLDEDMLMEKRDKLIAAMDLQFKSGEEAAFYRPSEDCIHMPDIDRFRNEYSYMATFLHEASHATGHKSRLNRDLTGEFGSLEYAKEELRAEISSAFTSQALGLSQSDMEHMENHKAYIQNWIAALEQNPNELFAAIKEAGKISDYLLTKGEFLTKERIQESKKQQQEQPENQQIRKKVQSSGRRR